MFHLYRFLGSSSAEVLGVAVYGKNGKWVKPLHGILHRIREVIWAAQHRWNPRHQYHVVRTGLKPGYYDIDWRLLHANMSLLCDYVEKEYDGEAKLQERIDYLCSEKAQEDYQTSGETMADHAVNDIEALRIYHWWKVKRPAEVARYEEMLHLRYSGPITFKDVSEELGEDLHELIIPEPPEGSPTSEEIWELERKIKQDEDDNLIALIKIRGALWT